MQVSHEEEAYLRAAGLDKLLASLAAQLFTHKPNDPLSFLINYLQEYKSNTKEAFTAPPMTEHEKELKDDAGHSNYFSSGENSPDTDEYFLSLRNAPKRRMAICCEPVDTSDLETGPFQPTSLKSPETQERLDKALKNNVLFSHLEEEERKEVFGAMVEVKFMAGDIIIRQGDEGDNFYVVESGECEVWVSKDGGRPEKVMEIGESGSFGELALIYGTQRAATVKVSSVFRQNYNLTIL